MILALYVFIAWVTISIFFLIPKGLSKEENLILFFSISIIVMTIIILPSLNFSLIQYSKKPTMHISMIINRNIIIPLCLLIFVNLNTFWEIKLKKIVITVFTLLFLFFMEYISVCLGIKKYTGWNMYLAIIAVTVLIIFSNSFTKWVKKIP